MDRKLASVQEIKEISTHPYADRLEIATVLGWKIIVAKDEFKVGDKIVYFEVDSMIPMCESVEFLRKSSLKVENGEEYARIRIQKMRKLFSEGLVMPLDAFGLDKSIEIGADLTDALGVIKYEPNVAMGFLGEVVNRFPNKIDKTDEPRIQSNLWMLGALKGKPCYITEKIDGTSITLLIQKRNDKWITRIYSRNNEILEDDKSQVWKYFKTKGIIDEVTKFLETEQLDGIFFQGEFYGESIQGNPLGIKGQEYRYFNIGNPDTGERWSFESLLISNIVFSTIDMVSLICHDPSFNYTLEELEELAKGSYPNGSPREGIVVRPQKDIAINGERLSFKVLNKEFLDKFKDK